MTDSDGYVYGAHYNHEYYDGGDDCRKTDL